MPALLKRLDFHLRIISLVLWCSRGEAFSGQGYLFEPAPPGRAPRCALPGLTYCLHPDPYPEHVIRHLIEGGRYDIRTLLSDESRDDFKAKKNDYPYGYGPNSLPHVDQISLVDDSLYHRYNKFHGGYNHDIFSQKTPLQPPAPVDPSAYNVNGFPGGNFTKIESFNGYHAPGNFWNPPSPNRLDGYDKKLYKQNTINNNFGYFNPNYYTGPTFNPNYDSTDWLRQGVVGGVTHYNPAEWWKLGSSGNEVAPTRTTRREGPRAPRTRRNADLVRAASAGKLTGAEALRIALGLASAETSAERRRRQLPPGHEELCGVRTEFITPRAALNNRGNWRYVVNMPENMTQMVRAEICTTTQCSGLCALPDGYTSRCEQKYIQKRLVALESNGQNLYTDLFWIPSCCQCTIMSN